MKQAAMIVLFFYLFVARVLGKGWYGALAVAIGQNGYHFHQITGDPGPTRGVRKLVGRIVVLIRGVRRQQHAAWPRWKPRTKWRCVM